MSTDFRTWDRSTLEQFAQEAAAENTELRAQLKALLDDWRRVLAQLEAARAQMAHAGEGQT